MKAMKRLVAVAVVFAGLGAGTAFANYPVIDVANLTESIEQVYQTYMDIQQAIQSVQNQYVQIKHAIEACKNINFDQFKALASPDAWENPETIRNAYKATLTAYNGYMNKLHNVENSFNAKHVRIGNTKISYADILGVGGSQDENSNAIDAISKEAKSINDRRKLIGDAYTGQLTWEERRKIMQEYGVSPRNYAETQVAEDVIERIGKKAISPIEDTEAYNQLQEQDRAAEEANALQTIKEMGEKAPESTIARQDLGNTLLAGLKNGVNGTNDSLQSLKDRIKKQHEEDVRREREKEARSNKRNMELRHALRQQNYKSSLNVR